MQNLADAEHAELEVEVVNLQGKRWKIQDVARFLDWFAHVVPFPAFWEGFRCICLRAPPLIPSRFGVLPELTLEYFFR